MSDNINNGGPAFPLATSSGANKWAQGMTLRDYFAAQALCGDMASQDEDFRFYVSDRENVIVERAVLCYRFADAMLKARDGDV